MSDADRIRALEAENAALRRRLEGPEALRYRALFDNNGLGICLVDAGGRLIECNAALCAALGRAPDELRGLMIATHTHPDDVDEDRRLFAELVAGRRDTYQHEKRYVRKDGSIFYGRLTNSPVRDERGRVQFVMRVVEDITARREAEQALRVSRALISALIEQLPALVFIKDIDGRFLVVNRSFAATLGATPEQLLGRHPRELYPPEVEAHFRARDQVVLDARGPITYEEPYRDAAGIDATRTVETTRFPLLDEHGRPYAVCGITYEITARRRAEEERLQFERKLLETQKLESLGLMAGSIAHDFNNLLVAVLGNASLALQELPAELPAREHLLEIELAARRAADLTRQMLVYAGKSQLTIKPVDLNSLVAESARLLQSSFQRRVGLRLELAPLLPAVMGDATQIRQVVMNLVLNGAEAISGPGGSVTVRTALERLERPAPYAGQTLAAGRYVLIEVRDTGHGMDQETQARIFEPFFTTKFTGRGLGLAAVQGIVRGHGGAIAVESAPGQGASFRVMLPASGAAAGEQRPEAAPARLSGSALVVDDDPEVLQIAVRMLGRLGLSVRSAEDGPSALRLLAEGGAAPDFALLDVNLPGMDGRQLLAAVWGLRPGMPVLMMSGDGEQEALSGAPRQGPLEFVAKPFTLPELADAARRALGR